MTSKVTEMKDFEELKQIIFKKLQEEIKEVNLYRLSGNFEIFKEQTNKYNKLFYTVNSHWLLPTYAQELIYDYGYTVEDIKKLMVKIATGMRTSNSDVELLNKILDRRKSNKSFDEIFNIAELIKNTDKLQEEFDSTSWFKRWWNKLWC